MAEQTLPRDTFSARLRELRDNPGAVHVRSTVDVSDAYGNTETWVIQTFRADGESTIFVQRNSAAGGDRFVIPPAVAVHFAAQRDRLIAMTRRAAARQGVATRRERGDRLGNPEALRKARGRGWKAGK